MSFSFLYKLHRIKNLFFLLLFLFPVLPIKLTNFIFIFYALMVLSLFIIEKQKIYWKSFVKYGIISLIALPYVIELIMFPHNTIIQFETEKKILFLVAPFIFYADSCLNRKNNHELAPLIFILCISFLSLVSLLYLGMNGNLFVNPSAIDYAFQLRYSFENFSGLHPSYYGLFSSTASLWILSFYKNYSRNIKIIWVICFVFLVLLNVLIASKMALIILIFGVLAIVYYFSETKLKKRLNLTIIFTLVILSLLFIPSLNNRLNEFYIFFKPITSENTIQERVMIFNCNKSIFFTDVLIGNGSRNTQALLDYCYTWCGYYKGALIHLNSHNQFFTFTLNYGIIYVMAFFALLLFLFLKQKASVLAKIFWFASILMMLSESFLERQMGIYYFLFFALLFQSIDTTRSTSAALH